MKIKRILLVALTALALSPAVVGVMAPALAAASGGHGGNAIIAGSKPGLLSGGSNITGVVVAPEPAIAGGLAGGVLPSGG